MSFFVGSSGMIYEVVANGLVLLFSSFEMSFFPVSIFVCHIGYFGDVVRPSLAQLVER